MVTNPNKCFQVAEPPNDSISSLSFSPKADLLVATSWDNEVRCWEIKHNSSNGTTETRLKASISHEQPVLCSTWNDDGTIVFSGGCDNQVKMWPLTTPDAQPTTVATHHAPIKDLAWIPEMELLVTGSWDRTLKYWDIRQASPVHTQPLPDRCYTLSVRHPFMVVGTADITLIVFDLRNPQVEMRRFPSPLIYQTRCVAIFPDNQGFLVGSIEGRVGVQHFDFSQQYKNYTFKSHKDGNTLYSVNSINFQPVYHTFSTAGSDGVVTIWDKNSKQKLKTIAKCNQPVSCATFNNNGSIFVYSVCYDWSKGEVEQDPGTSKSQIFLHFPKV
ncbi:protein RAE1-like isoform X2 [Humulus lupulus]|uniref:protein RAE1-like isoform X2 n=1 Tax=Humulus lupulus TaxID=3486 RepID=UPI002B411C04|nr:protein RAE1-like isoform X2 [Humulus lupulus]